MKKTMDIILNDGEVVECREYHDIDPDESGVEVSRPIYHNKYEVLGQIQGESLPDPENKEEVEAFSERIQNWVDGEGAVTAGCAL